MMLYSSHAFDGHGAQRPGVCAGSAGRPRLYACGNDKVVRCYALDTMTCLDELKCAPRRRPPPCLPCSRHGLVRTNSAAAYGPRLLATRVHFLTPYSDPEEPYNALQRSTCQHAEALLLASGKTYGIEGITGPRRPSYSHPSGFTFWSGVGVCVSPNALRRGPPAHAQAAF